MGVQSNHVTADGHSVWVSSYPRDTTTNPGRLTRIDPAASAPQVTVSRIYPGAGALALVDGGLWVARFDGQGELDRLNAATGTLTGPFLVMPDDPIVLVQRGDGLWVLSYRSTGNVRTVTKVTLTPGGEVSFQACASPSSPRPGLRCRPPGTAASSGWCRSWPTGWSTTGTR